VADTSTYPKTLLEFYQEPPLDVDKGMVQALALWMQRSGGAPSFVEAAQHLALVFGIPVNNDEGASMALSMWMRAWIQLRGIERWWLDAEAVTACMQTRLPADLLDGRLPRLPRSAMMIVIPTSMAIELRTAHPALPTIPVSQILLVEEEPQLRWRFIGINTTTNVQRLAFTRGFLDARNGPILRQLEENYTFFGTDALWRLLANLFLVHEHRHLVEREVRPRVPMDKVKARKARQRCSFSPFKVIDLTEGTRIVPAGARASLESEGHASPRWHWVAGHWRGYWRLDPDPARPVLATQERDDKPPLYKQATWILPFARGLGGGDGAAPREARVTASPARPLAVPKRAMGAHATAEQMDAVVDDILNDIKRDEAAFIEGVRPGDVVSWTEWVWERSITGHRDDPPSSERVLFTGVVLSVDRQQMTLTVDPATVVPKTRQAPRTKLGISAFSWAEGQSPRR